MMLSTVLGPDVASRIAAAKLLVVGAGGIGCETLKNLVMHGFRHIHVVDLDTIDATNLNRQFLFRKHHVDASKAQVACETVRKFGNVMMGPALGKAPSTATSTGGGTTTTRKGEALQELLHLEAHHGDVKTFDSEFFEQFDFVLNCLDNMSARHHVNRVCVALKKPLLEAGTTGHAGQTTVHVPHHTECYECMARPKPQKFPVCTIRKTPDKFIHCVTWAKNLFDALFSAPPAPSGEQMIPAEEVDHDSGDMMSDLRDDRLLRVSSEEETLDAAVALVDKLFGGDIQALYDSGEIANTWKGNRPRPKEKASRTWAEDQQRVWCLETTIVKLLNSILAVKKRLKAEPATSVAFRKEDDAAVDFVTAVSNLRALNYSIFPLKTKWEVTSMAGNIVPAIATTNAIVAGLQVANLVHLIVGSTRDCFCQYPEAFPSKRLGRLILKPSKLILRRG
eukprot:g8759.t1